jgi:hypothetical protein
LSNERLQTVETYVQSRIASSKAHFDRQALGEGDPQDPAAYENELDRSVAVKARFFPAPPEPRKIRLLIPKYNPWKPRKNRKVMDFTLQVLKAQIDIFTLDLKLPFASVGQGRAKVKLFIEIKELGTKDTAQYEFDGSGIGGIASAGFSIKKARPGLGLSSWSQTFEKGKKHRFATTTPMDADDFAGGALFEKSVRGRFSFNFGPVHGLLGASIKIPSLGLGKPTSPTSPFSLAECLVSAKMKQVTSTPSWAK